MCGLQGGKRIDSRECLGMNCAMLSCHYRVGVNLAQVLKKQTGNSGEQRKALQ